MAVSIGSVSVDVVPSAEGFVRDLAAQILPGAGRLGEELGQNIGEAAAREAAGEISEGVEDGVRRSRPEREAGKKGRSAGGRFAREFKAEVEAALRDLPDIDVDAATGGAQAAIAGISAQLKELADKNIGVDISAADGIVAVRAIRAELESLRDKQVDVNFDIDGALASLGKLERKIADDLGGSFDRSLRQALSNATRQLPDIQIDADTGEAQRKLTALRDELAAMSDFANINVDIDAASSLAEIERLAVQLQALVDDESIDLKVRLDAAAALKGLEGVRTAAGRIKNEIEEADREVGDFARTIRAKLQTAFEAIPDIDIDANTDPARAALTQLREEVAAFRDLEIGVDIDTEQALRGTAIIIAQLEAIAASSPDIDVRSNAAKVIAELQAVIAAIQAVDAVDPEVDVEVNTPDPGAFATKLRQMLAKAQASLPEIQVDGNTDPVDRKVAELRARLGTISASIDIDTDIGAVLADLAVVEAAARALDNDDVDIEIRADAQAVLAQLAAIRAAAIAAGNGFDDGFGDNTFKKINRIRLIMAAVFAIFPLVAGAVLGLSAALSLIVTPVAAIALGLDGIQAAVKPLTEDFNNLRDAVSNAFEKGLQPAVANTAKLFPVLNDGLVATAFSLSEVADNVTRVITSGRNLDVIQNSFDKINGVIESLSPAFELLTQNMIDLTNIGAGAMAAFGTQLQTVGQDFAEMIARLSDTGTAQAAIEAFFSVLSSVIGLIGPLTEFGAVLMAAFGPALAGVLDTLGVAFSAVAQAIELLPPVFQEIVAIALTLRVTMLLLGVAFPTTAAAMGVLSTATTGLGIALINLRTAIQTIGTAFTTSLGAGLMATAAAGLRGIALAIRAIGVALFANPIGLLITGLVIAFSLFGQANADAAAAETEHKQAIQELATALRDTGGAIDSNILAMTRKKLESTGASEAARQLGEDEAQVANAIARGGPAYDALREKLTAIATSSKPVLTSLGELSVSNQDNAIAAQKLLDVMGPMREEFVGAAEANQQLAQALAITGTSLAGGLANALALEGAISTLGDASSTTSDKVKALKDALDALNGGTLTAEEAAAKLEASIDKIGSAFEEAQEAAKKTGAALIDATGGIDKTTEAGRKLFDETMNIRDGMMEAATSAFDAAGGLNNVEAASAAAAGKVQSARDAFIGAAREAGIGALEAEKLANRYGLIPELVTTLLRAEGLPQVTQELSHLSSLIKNQIPGTKEVRVTALSQSALTVLDQLQVKVRGLEDGSFAVTVDDMTVPGIEGILGYIASQEGKLPVDADAHPMQRTIDDQIASLQAQKRELPVGATLERQLLDAQIDELRSRNIDLPVGADPAPLQGQIPGLIGDVTAAGPANLPVGADGSTVAPTVDGLRSSVASVPAQLTIEPGGMAYVQIAIAGIRRDIATPVNFSIGVSDNASALIGTIRTTASGPVTFPISATDAGVSALIGQLRASAAQPNTMPISGMDSGVSALIGQLRASISQPNTMPITVRDDASATIGRLRASIAQPNSMPIDANPAGADGKLRTLINSITGTTATMKIDAAVGDAEGKLATIKSAVERTTAVMKIDADPALADGKLRTLIDNINGSTGVVKVEADTATAQNQIDILARPRRTTLTVDIVVNGTMPNAAGNILPANFSFFANGGMASGKLSPMQGNYARMVQPNTFRVIGDNARYPEAYIPINRSSPRSKALLKATAAGMGYGLVPMATGGLLSSLASTMRLASAVDKAPISTQPGSLVTAASGNNKAVERKLDQLIQVLSTQPRGPQTITVEDRSGNPVETARATQLALRLAR